MSPYYPNGFDGIPKHLRHEVEAFIRSIAPELDESDVEWCVHDVDAACDGDDMAPNGMVGLRICARKAVEIARRRAVLVEARLAHALANGGTR